MKKLFILCAVLFALSNITWAQASNYGFASSSGTYTALSSETILWSATFDDEVSSSITIPSFTFNGTAYTSMYVSANGWLTLGTTAPSGYSPISGTGTYSAAISPYGNDLQQAGSGTPQVSYNTNDGGEIVVQWQDARRYGTSYSTHSLSFQARLNPTTGVIKFVYGGTIAATSGSATLQVGLRGSANTDFNNRTTTTNWAATTAGTLNSSSMTFSSTVLPASGLTYTFTPPPPLDMGAITLVSPGTVGCYGTNQTVTVRIKNYGSQIIDFAVNNVTVNSSVTGPNPQTFGAVVLNSGTLAVNATQDVVVSTTYNMSATGTYTFNASTSVTGDGNAGNDAMTAQTRTLAASVSLPQTVDFTGYTGANLTTVFPNWYEAAGATPTGTTSLWTSQTGLGVTGNITARINLYTTSRNEWIIGPKLTPTATTVLKFKAAVSDWNSIVAGDAMGSDDKVRVMVSNDCGVTWTSIFQLDATSSLSLTLTEQSVSLGSYSGQPIIVAFYATDGPVDDAADYDFHIDDIYIGEPPAAPIFSIAPTSFNFGSTFAGTPTAYQQFTISNSGGGTLTITSGNISLTGTDANQFALADSNTYPISLTAGQTAKVYVRFAPTTSGYKSANLTIVDNTVDATQNVPLSGKSLALGSLFESFTGTTFPPSKWKVVNRDGGANQWSRFTSKFNTTPASAGSNYESSSLQNDDWLITPKLSVVTGDSISFWHSIQSSTYPEDLYVKVGTTNDPNTGTWTDLAYILDNTTTWKYKAYDLSAYNGQNIYIAFVNRSFDAWTIYVDDVGGPIVYIPANDVGTTSIDIASSLMPGTVAPKATVKNFGSSTNSFNVTMTITGGYTSTQAVTSLAPGASQQVTFANWNPALGDYSVKVYTQLATDEDASNDTLTKNVAVSFGLWTSGQNYPTNTYLGSGVGYTKTTVEAVNGYLFSIGGNTTSLLGTECYKYDVAADSWSAIAPLPAGRRVLATAVVGDYVYAIGGSDMSSVYQSTVYKYDIVGNSWTTVASLPAAIAWGKAVGYGNYIYFAGGVDAASTYLSTVYVYDVSANTWSAATSMPGPKFGGAFSVVGNQLVYAAGANGTVISSDVYVGTITANPLVITWTLAAKYPGLNKETVSRYIGDIKALEQPKVEEMSKSDYSTEATSYPPGAMYRFDGAPWGNDGMIVAGGSPSTAWTPANPNPCYVYKPATDNWVKQADVPIPVLGASLGSCNSGSAATWKLIVASGLGSVEQPATQIWSVTGKSLNLTALIEGMYTGTQVSDSVTVELRNSTAPYGVVEKSKVVLNASGNATAGFLSAADAVNYYIAVKHRNALETWSKNPQTFTAGTLNYNFTTAAAQAFGDNMILKLTKYCFYSGDVNRDGVVDLTDVSTVDTDNLNFVSGYTATDVNGDNLVDLSDLSIVDTNNLNFISKVTPGGVVLKKVKAPINKQVQNNQ